MSINLMWLFSVGHRRISSLDSYDPNTNFATKLRAATALIVPPGEKFSPKPGPSGMQNPGPSGMQKPGPSGMPKVPTVKRSNVSAAVVVEQSPLIDPFMDDMDIANLEDFEKPAASKKENDINPKKPNDIIFEGQVDVITSEVTPPTNSIVLASGSGIPKKRPALRDVTNQMSVFEDKKFQASFFSDFNENRNTIITNQQHIIARDQELRKSQMEIEKKNQEMMHEREKKNQEMMHELIRSVCNSNQELREKLNNQKKYA